MPAINTKDPNFAGEYGYQALGAYSSGLEPPPRAPSGPSESAPASTPHVDVLKKSLLEPNFDVIKKLEPNRDVLGRLVPDELKGTVICTELLLHHDATAAELATEYRFVATLPVFIVHGYRLWAVPYVAQMRKHPILYVATRPFARAFLHESAALLGERHHSALGLLVMALGFPICALAGLLTLIPKTISIGS